MAQEKEEITFQDAFDRYIDAPIPTTKAKTDSILWFCKRNLSGLSNEEVFHIDSLLSD
ncbi:MAG: hypothetical protein MK105_17890 [Crocinitomicaceae bacterium]|nr:hypothetical protein [Crocinitomicaceae bacterium]